MTNKLIKTLALGAFAIGGGITTLASTSCGGGSSDKIYVLQSGDYTTSSSKFTGFNSGVLDRIKSQGYNGIEFPTDTVTSIDVSSYIWNNNDDFIKTVEIPSNIISCTGYDSSCFCVFPKSITKLVIDASSFTFKFHLNEDQDMLDNATMLDTIVFENATADTNIILSNIGTGEGFRKCGTETSKNCVVKCPKMDDSEVQTFSTKLKSNESDKGHLPEKWTVTNK